MSVIVHRGASFLVADSCGDIDPSGVGGFYVHDTRFLSRWQLRLDGRLPMALSASTAET